MTATDGCPSRSSTTRRISFDKVRRHWRIDDCLSGWANIWSNCSFTRECRLISLMGLFCCTLRAPTCGSFLPRNRLPKGGRLDLAWLWPTRTRARARVRCARLCAGCPADRSGARAARNARRGCSFSGRAHLSQDHVRHRWHLPLRSAPRATRGHRCPARDGADPAPPRPGRSWPRSLRSLRAGSNG